MQITIGDYVIRPYSNGLCWTIDHWEETKRRDGKKEVELKNMGKFPSSLESAVNLVAEMLLKDDAVEIAHGFEEVTKEIRNFKKQILKNITVVTVTPKKRSR